MIISFSDGDAEELYLKGTSERIPHVLQRRAIKKFEMLDNARTLEDLAYPTGNRLHALKGNRLGQHSIAINGQYRICYRFEEDGVHDVEICDYH